MPDGQAHADDEFDVIDPTALDDAIRRLEAGEPVPEHGIDLGGGCIARPDGPMGQQGLLQRLKGHRQLIRLARNRTVVSDTPPVLTVCEDVRALLEAVRGAG